MISAYDLVLEEADETEGDVLTLSECLEHYGFDKVRGVGSYQEVLNKRGKAGSRQYTRV